MKKLLALLLACACLLPCVLCACGDNNQTGEDTSLTYIKNKGELILGLDDSFPPMGYKDENGDIVGFDIDVATEVCNRMGVTLKLQPISWKAKEQEIASKSIDCIWNGFTSNEQRQKNLTCSEPYMKNTQVVVLLKDSKVNSLDDLAGKKVVIQTGSTAADAIDANPDFKNSIEVISLEDNVKAMMDLKVGGSDAVVMDEVVARYYLTKDPDSYKILDTALADEIYVIGFRKGDEALCNEVNKYIEEMRADGTLKKLSEKWVGKDLTSDVK